MHDKGVPATVEKQTACMAALIILIGAGVLWFAHLTALGWVVVAYGVMLLCLAYLLATAPIIENP